MFDYHTHHYRCGHADGNLEDYIASAVRKGLKEIGLSDHSPIYHRGENPHILPDTAMSWDELGKYFEEAVLLKRKYQNTVEVRIGIESDYVPGWEDHFRSLWDRDEMDFVIGSIHWVDDWHIFASKQLPPGLSKEELFSAYVDRLMGAAVSGIYNIIGHMDAIKQWELVPPQKAVEGYTKVLQAMADLGVALELNTSGWRKRVKEQYPARDILVRAHRLGVPVSLGSDAHKPELVGADFDTALKMLRDIGYKQIATFQGKQLRLVDISEATTKAV